VGANLKLRSGGGAQSDFGAVDPENQRIASRSAAGGLNLGARNKAKLHQTRCLGGRQLDARHNAFFAGVKIGESGGMFQAPAMTVTPASSETQLQHDFSMHRYDFRRQAGGFSRFQIGAKCAKTLRALQLEGAAASCCRAPGSAIPRSASLILGVAA